jgi:hypothetical protein
MFFTNLLISTIESCTGFAVSQYVVDTSLGSRYCRVWQQYYTGSHRTVTYQYNKVIVLLLVYRLWVHTYHSTSH